MEEVAVSAIQASTEAQKIIRLHAKIAQRANRVAKVLQSACHAILECMGIELVRRAVKIAPPVGIKTCAAKQCAKSVQLAEFLTLPHEQHVRNHRGKRRTTANREKNILTTRQTTSNLGSASCVPKVAIASML